MLTQRQRRILTDLQGRHGRRRSEFFTAEGVRACCEAVSRRPEWLEFVACTGPFLESDGGRALVAKVRSASQRPAVEVVEEHDLEALSSTEHPQGVLCLLRRPQNTLPEDIADPFVLVLDRLREPGNLGTLLRTAWAVGLGSVWLTRGSADPFEAKVVRAGMGAQFSLRLVQAGDLAEVRAQLAARGRQPLYLTVPSGGVSCFAPEFSLSGGALVIGNEADGIADLSLGPHVSIPMPGRAESLNAAQAATVFLCDAVRRGILR